MIASGGRAEAERAPIVTIALILANLLGFWIELSLGDGLGPFVDRWGMVPSDLAAFLVGADHNPAVLITLLTATFLHAGWVHLSANMLYLWIFGDDVEAAVGHLRYLALYLVSGLAAGLVQTAAVPAAVAPAIGASGAIAGVLGAYVILYPNATLGALLPAFRYRRLLDVPALVLLALWLVIHLFSGVATLTPAGQTSGSTAWWGHVGGFATGLILVNFFRRRRKGRTLAISGGP